MGGWMDYQRFRKRNGLMYRTSIDEDPYAWHLLPEEQVRFDPSAPPPTNMHTICGDLNRMERDYLKPRYPNPPFARRPQDSDPASVTARETGVSVEDVRKVLSHVFGILL